MNKDNLQKELLDTIKEGDTSGDILKKIKAGKEAKKQKSDGSISLPPPPPPPPPMPGANNPELEKRITALEAKLDDTLKKLATSETIWSQTAQRYLTSLQKSMATNDRLEGVIKELMKSPVKLSGETEQAFQEAHQIIRDLKQENKDLKLGYSEDKPTPRNITIPLFMTEQEKQIIEQATAQLEPLINTTTLRDRILEAQKIGTKKALWDLHTDLTHPGLYLDKLLQFYGNTDDTTLFTWTLGAILRGERLKDIQETK